MKKGVLSVLLLMILIVNACSKTEEPKVTCVKAEYITQYCSYSDNPISYVRLLEPSVDATSYVEDDSTSYYAAIVDLPRELQKANAVFYVSYYIDAKKAKAAKPIVCPAFLPPTNILICKTANTAHCQ